MKKPVSRQSVSWGLVTACAVVGAGFIMGALWIERSWADPVVWQGILVSLGATIALLGIVAILTPKFFREVERAAERGIERSEARVEARVEERLTRRLDDLQDQIDREVRNQAAEQDQVVARLGDTATAEQVAKILHEANSINAIKNGMITVPAGPGPEHYRMQFAWLAEVQYQNPYDRTRDYIYSEPALMISIESVTIEWRFEDEPSKVVSEIIRQLRKEGEWYGEGRLDFGIALRNLQSTLDLAIRSRRRDAKAMHFKGALIEKYDENFYVTSEGIEAPSEGYLLERLKFSHQYWISDDQWKSLRDARPDFVDMEKWNRVLTIAIRQYERSGVADIVPWGEDPLEQQFPSSKPRKI